MSNKVVITKKRRVNVAIDQELYAKMKIKVKAEGMVIRIWLERLIASVLK
jgi:predicted DNA binding CopG/RHH family protein